MQVLTWVLNCRNLHFAHKIKLLAWVLNCRKGYFAHKMYKVSDLSFGCFLSKIDILPTRPTLL